MLLNAEQILSHEVISTLFVVIISLVIYITMLLIVRQIFINKPKELYRIVIGLLGYIILFVGIIIILNIWGIDLYPFLIALGIVLFLIGLSMQEVLKDLISGLRIYSSKPFVEGDTVEINSFKGTVQKVSLLYTKVLGLNGEVKTISNRFIDEVINYSENLIIGFVDIEISLNENIEKVSLIISDGLTNLIESYPQIVEGPNVLGIVEINGSQKLRVSFKSKAESVSLIERSLRKELVKICISNNINIANHNGVKND